MRAQKPNFAVYSSLSKIGGVSKPTNVLDLIKRNKAEEKKDKKQAIYVAVGFVVLALFVGILIFS